MIDIVPREEIHKQNAQPDGAAGIPQATAQVVTTTQQPQTLTVQETPRTSTSQNGQGQPVSIFDFYFSENNAVVTLTLSERIRKSF